MNDTHPIPPAVHAALARPHLRLVVALGGNALSLAHEEGNIDQQFGHASMTSRRLAPLVAAGHQLILTHGNGPQVGNILHRVEIASREIYPIPLSIAVADTQAGIGLMLSMTMGEALAAVGIDRSVTPFLTLVEVDPADPAFTHPTKPIGPTFDRERAVEHSGRFGWSIRETSPGKWRRVVPSPVPLRLPALDLLRELYEGGHLLIAGGGGGVPMVREADGRHTLRDAVVDKDLTSALIARDLGVDMLVILTGTPNVAVDFGKPTERRLGVIAASELDALRQEGHFPAGSMGPKVLAVLEFLKTSPHPCPLAIITDQESIEATLRGEAGTIIYRDDAR